MPANQKKGVLISPAVLDGLPPPLNLGEEIMDRNKLSRLNLNLGVIDKSGIYHFVGVEGNKQIDHNDMVEHLAAQKKIMDYYIRVGCSFKQNDELWGGDTLPNADWRNFLLNEKMAMALYNGVESKDDGYSIFEERLGHFGTDFGFYSTQFRRRYPDLIYDKKKFNENMSVLESTVGRRNFDKKFFVDILENGR